MRHITGVLILIILFTSCSKDVVHDVVGNWQIEKQLTISYSGNEKTGENYTDLCDSYMQLGAAGTGYFIYSSTETTFKYIVHPDEIVISTESCKKSTWFIAEYTGETMVLEHSSPYAVTVRYLRRVS